jgi:hypothetical protein
MTHVPLWTEFSVAHTADIADGGNDMRAAERVVMKVMREEMVGPTDTNDSYLAHVHRPGTLQLHSFVDNASTLQLHSFTGRGSTR